MTPRRNVGAMPAGVTWLALAAFAAVNYVDASRRPGSDNGFAFDALESVIPSSFPLPLMFVFIVVHLFVTFWWVLAARRQDKGLGVLTAVLAGAGFGVEFLAIVIRGAMAH